MQYSKVFDYPDLFKDVADALRIAENYQEALQFYEPLQQVENLPPDFYHSGMASCYHSLGLVDQAEQCFRLTIDADETNLDALRDLIRMFVEAGRPDRADPYVKELASKRPRARQLAQTQAADAADLPIDSIEDLAEEALEVDDDHAYVLDEIYAASKSRKKKGSHHKGKTASQKRPQKGPKPPVPEDKDFVPQFLELHQHQQRIAAGESEAKADWLEVSRPLIERFKASRALVPLDRHIKFMGYTAEARELAKKPGHLVDGTDPLLEPIPTGFAGIAFEEWLDTFMNTGVYLAEEGSTQEAYATMKAASDCVVWRHSKESMLIVHMTWAVCALLNADDQTITDVCRYIMREYQFVTDSYRLYAALHLLCPQPNLWYNGNAAQKFILRQIKAVDFSLIGAEKALSVYNERAYLHTRDAEGNPIEAQEMDVALLMLYGQMLYTAGSYTQALNYFFRCLALDPDNLLVNLTAGLAFLHHAIKRQAENRHGQIIQALSFLFKYLQRRETSQELVERQEAFFNVGRAFHTIGLQHLAVDYYEKSLEIGQEMKALKLDKQSDSNRSTVDADGDTAMDNANHVEEQRVPEPLRVNDEIGVGREARENGEPRNRDQEQRPEAAVFNQIEGGSSASPGHAVVPDDVDDFEEDFSMEAAYALQTLWLVSENTEMALEVTEKWLVI